MIKGQKIPDFLIIKALIAKIKSHFENKTEEQILEDHEIEKNKFKNSLFQEEEIPSSLIRTKTSESKVSNISKQYESKEPKIQDKKASYYSKGFVIIGFPNTYEQVFLNAFDSFNSKKVKEFEASLSDFIPEDERPKIQADIEKNQILNMIRFTNKSIIPRKVL